MSEATMTPRPTAETRPDDEVPLLEYLVVLWRFRWLVGGFCLVFTVSAMAYLSLAAPFSYLATATILSPRETGPGGMLGGLLGGGDAASGLSSLSGSVSAAPNRDQFVGVMRSRRISMAAVEKFDLRKRYELPLMDDAVKELTTKRMDISITREGVIAVAVEDGDPYIAAAIANFFVNELDRVVTAYNTSEAGRTRGFMTEQLGKARTSLAQAEQQLRRFQERNQAILLQDQTRGAIDAAARLKAEVIAADVQLQVMRTWLTDASPDVQSQLRKIDEMKRYLADLQYGDEAPRRGVNATAGRDQDFHVPFAKVPGVGLELIRLTREMKVQEAVVQLLIQQFEQAKLTEAKDLPTVRVLDAAAPSDKHSKPKFLLFTILTFVGSAFLGTLLPFAVEYARRISRAWPDAEAVRAR
ncbi:MAG: GNVR domain-containing protein [Dehalococcoidia bacterium]